MKPTLLYSTESENDNPYEKNWSNLLKIVSFNTIILILYLEEITGQGH